MNVPVPMVSTSEDFEHRHSKASAFASILRSLFYNPTLLTTKPPNLICFLWKLETIHKTLQKICKKIPHSFRSQHSSKNARLGLPEPSGVAARAGLAGLAGTPVTKSKLLHFCMLLTYSKCLRCFSF